MLMYTQMYHVPEDENRVSKEFEINKNYYILVLIFENINRRYVVRTYIMCYDYMSIYYCMWGL